MENRRYELIEPRGVTGSGLLGEGAYGLVYKALDKDTGNFVALKKIKPETERDGISSATLREVSILLKLRHNNIVRLLNVWNDRDNYNLIFELIDMDLKRVIDRAEDGISMDNIKVRPSLVE
jgi:serine/threonine protein kinase